MRNQFYSDRKDIWKWSLLLELAGDRHHIYQVAMLTRDDGEHTLDQGDPGECNALARGFFEDECRVDDRDIYRAEALLSGRITVLNPKGSDCEYYSPSSRTRYFDHVLNTIKSDDKSPKVVFLDPDNGLEVKNSTSSHVRLQDVRRVWNSLRAGDYLVIYQHHARVFLNRYMDDKRRQIGDNLKVAQASIQHRTHKAVSFFWLEKH